MINDNMMCAQDMDSEVIDEDTCVGDSGGPMVLRDYDSNGDLQVGVVSWGIGCASQTFPVSCACRGRHRYLKRDGTL